MTKPHWTRARMTGVLSRKATSKAIGSAGGVPSFKPFGICSFN